MKTTAFFIVMAVTVLVLPVCPSPLAPNNLGTLNIVNNANNLLEAVYYTTEMGIRIYSNATFLQIKAMGSGTILLAGQKTSESSKLVSIVGSNFVQETINENGQQRKFEYEVINSQLEQVKQDLKTRKAKRRNRGQSDERVRSAEEGAFQRFLALPEIRLIEPAVEALGGAGVKGLKNQGALQFYALAMSIVRELSRQIIQDVGSGSVETDENSGREKRFFFDPRPTIGPTLTLAPPTIRPTSICDMYIHPSQVLTSWPSICRNLDPPTNRICFNNNLIPFEPFGRNKRLTLEPGYWCCKCHNDICRIGCCIAGTTSCNGYCPDWENCRGICGRGCNSCWYWMCNTCCYQQGCYNRFRSTNYLDMWFPIHFSCTGIFTNPGPRPF